MAIADPLAGIPSDILAKLDPEEVRALVEFYAPQAAAAAQRTADLEDPVSWMEANFWVPDLQVTADDKPHRGLIVLPPHIKTLLRYIFDPNRTVYEYFQTIIWSVPKKSAKTTISAAVGRWIAEIKGPYSDVVYVANDREQAKGRAYEYATRSLGLDPRWDHRRDELTTAEHSGRTPLWYTSQQGAFFWDGGKMRAIAKDYKGEAGANQNAAIFTEIAFMTEERARRLWDELTPPPTRWAIRWAEGYAGFEGEGELWRELWELFREAGNWGDATEVKLAAAARRVTREELEPYGGWVNWDGSPFADEPPVYVNETARAVGYIDQGVAARRMPWQQGRQGRAYYASQEATERPEAYRRLHLNEWVSPVDEFIPIEWWDACQLHLESEYTRATDPQIARAMARRLATGVSPTSDATPSWARWKTDLDGRPLIPPLDEHMPVVIGVDASVTGDCSALVGVSRAPWAPHTEVVVRFAHIWTPPAQRDRQGKKIGLDYHTTIEAEIRRAVNRYNVVQVCYDPYQMHHMMTNIMRGRVTRERDDWGDPNTPAGQALPIEEASDLEVWCYPFSQASERNRADKQLYDLIKERRIWHPAFPELTAHIRNAAAKTAVNEDTKLRLVKKAPSSKIDGAVALAMACFSCLNLNIS